MPDGWQLCDGSNGTPDLVDRFLVGAGDTYALAATGGAASVNLSHRHQVESHNHTISTADLSHTHSVPSHRHGVLAHSHTIPSHVHSISSDNHSHTLTQVATLVNRADGRPIGVWSSDGYLHVIPAESGTGTYYVVDDLTTSHSHSHGGWTGSYDGMTGSSGGYTSWESGTSGAMSANSTHNHGGATGSVSPYTDYQLSNVSTVPPYYAVYYICSPGLAAGETIRFSDPYTFAVSSGETIEVPRQFTYGDIVIISLLSLLLLIVVAGLFWIAIKGR